MDPYRNIFSKCLIIDLGSGYTKAGLSHEENPRFVVESMVGHPIMSRIIPSNKNNLVVGTKGHSLSLYKYDQPIKRGIIQNFDSIKLIINKILEELRIKSLTDIPIIITESTGIPLSQRKRLIELIFENYDASCIYFGNQAVLALNGLGKTSGCVLDIGYGLAQVGCVYNGYKLEHSFERSDVGGADIDAYLSVLLRKGGLDIKVSTEISLLKTIKESKCELTEFDKTVDPLNRKKELQQTEDAVVVLPDGQEVKIGSERFLAPEILFKPELFGLAAKGVHCLLAESIDRTNIELKNKLYKNINLAGGTTCIKNFAHRLSDELKGLVPSNAVLSINDPQTRKDYQAWHGAYMLSVSNDLSNLWIKKTEYKEMGEAVLVKKGF